MDFFEAVEKRRSIRRYSEKPVPDEVMQKAFNAAQIAPNSSNLQLTEFHWVHTPEKKKRLAEACLSQGAARTAQELVIALAVVSNWKKNNEVLLKEIEETKGPALELQRQYYGKHIPFLYGYAWLAPFKWLLFFFRGLRLPTPRHPWSRRDLEEIAIKSGALACENFMLAISAQGFDTCPMEGFDEVRVKKLIGAPPQSRVIMVISAGERSETKALWGPRSRLPLQDFLKKH